MSDQSTPTIRVANPGAPGEFMIINECDLGGHHELWTDAAASDSALFVGKGPRGKFYVKSGKELIAGPFETEADAHAEMGRA